MLKTMTLNVRVSGALGEFVAAPDGAYQPLDADTVIMRGQQRSGA